MSQEKLQPDPTTDITPANWETEKASMPTDANGLLKMVFEAGSTHNFAPWRLDGDFIKKLVGKLRFNPVVKDWDPSFAKYEAEAIAKSGVIAFGIQNISPEGKTMNDGSLGSLGEISLALLRTLRGARMVVWAQPGIETTFTEPRSKVLFRQILGFLDNARSKKEGRKMIALTRETLAEFGDKVDEAMRDQTEKPADTLDPEEITGKVEQKILRVKHATSILIAGSSEPFSNRLKKEEPFDQYRDNIRTMAKEKEGVKVRDVATGILKHMYHWLDSVSKRLKIETYNNLSDQLLDLEDGWKANADVLILPVFAQAASMAAAAEVPYRIYRAVESGQTVITLVEEFDHMLYLHEMYNEALEKDDTWSAAATLTDKTRVLAQLGVTIDPGVAEPEAEIEKAFSMLQTLGSKEYAGVDVGAVKKSLLSKSGVWKKMDNIRRTRALMKAHIEELAKDEQLSRLFILATDRDDLLAKIQTVVNAIEA